MVVLTSLTEEPLTEKEPKAEHGHTYNPGQPREPLGDQLESTTYYFTNCTSLQKNLQEAFTLFMSFLPETPKVVSVASFLKTLLS